MQTWLFLSDLSLVERCWGASDFEVLTWAGSRPSDRSLLSRSPFWLIRFRHSGTLILWLFFLEELFDLLLSFVWLGWLVVIYEACDYIIISLSVFLLLVILEKFRQLVRLLHLLLLVFARWTRTLLFLGLDAVKLDLFLSSSWLQPFILCWFLSGHCSIWDRLYLLCSVAS